ncbi:hypothetical protein [Nesterenkonia alkaliphila]|uniref:DUF4352 domain-containing protein n=1 Tax=Nesterenkonia alkaliphila TaxID=1463631 RepID=A0A7K1UJE8_9MICC|nr:hypothetical protein [Nesterenkonia alkaliphila]MVT26615.1 hypothetical protein [Nesterenkonia alkaliphila]GFZ92214.1 hypothetical protein GCM10011359_21900 [Nesterenkonia alkaliphila]
MKRTSTAALLAGTATLLMISGCSQAQEIGEQLEEFGDAVETGLEEVNEEIAAQQESADAEPSQTEDDAAEVELAAAEERVIGLTGHQAGVHYEVETVRTIPQEDGSLVVEADMRFTNPSNSNRTVVSGYELRWQAGADTYAAPGFATDFNQIPANASNSGQIEITVPAADAEGFTLDEAVLLIGNAGSSAAEIALGPEGDTISRVPIEISDLIGAEAQLQDEDVDDLVTISYAEVRWGGPDLTPLPDGQAHILLEYTVQNRSDAQSCSTRSSGGWSLEQPNGDSVLDDGVSERCARGGETVSEILTGFTVDAEVVGDYTMTHTRSRAGEATGEWTFSIPDPSELDFDLSEW